MRDKPYIAELHDIGKLADREALERAGLKITGHTFHDFDFAQLGIHPPSSPSWWGQWHHDVKGFDKLPTGISDEEASCLLLTVIADKVAASISRPDKDLPKGAVGESLHLLWRGKVDEKLVFRTPADLKQMFSFIAKCQSAEEFLQEFMEALVHTPEDKSVPRNIVPLKVHLELVGKIFRVLRQHTELKDRFLYYGQEKIKDVVSAIGKSLPSESGSIKKREKGKWAFRLVQGRVLFPQTLVRLQDLNVLRLRREKIEEIVEKQYTRGEVERQPYAVLFYTDDFISVFLPQEDFLSFKQIMQPLLDAGFYLECEEIEGELSLITSDGKAMWKCLTSLGIKEDQKKCDFKLRYISIWQKLEDALTPPLCDVCQLRPGELEPKGPVHEWLCPVCREIRDMGEPAIQLAQWDEEGKPVAWLKISLDQELLLQCLRRLFNQYVDSGPGMNQVSENDRKELKESFRPLAAQMEFVRHYQKFLEDFQAQLYSLNIEPETVLYPISEYKELIVVRLDQEEALGVVLDSFLQLLQEHFPKCLEDCPIRLSASVSNIKHPFHEHWRFFEEVQKPGLIFDLQQPSIRRVQLTADQFEALRRELKGEKFNHFLYRLIKIETNAGEVFATVEALNERSKFSQLLKLLEQHKLTFRQILDFYRLIGIVEELSVHAK